MSEEDIRAAAAMPRPSPAATTSPLSLAQVDALERRAAGYTPRQIAADVGTTADKISGAIDHARRRLGARNNPAAIAAAIGEGIIDYQRIRQHRTYLESRG